MTRRDPSLLMLALAASFGATAVAAQPRPPYQERFDFSYEAEPVASCGDFVMLADGAGTTHLTTYFERDGVPARVTLHGVYDGLLTNPLNGKTLADAPSVPFITIDLASGVRTNIGTYWNVTVPGEGVIVIEAGRLVFDGAGPPVFIAGPHLPPPATIAILCDALR
jgi:hypothetical protein